MKRILLALLLFSGLASSAQSYNNEWIDYSKTYYKIKVLNTGIYRIAQSVLATAGLGSIPAEHFQLWRNGQQIPIYTSVQTGTMGSSDYIEFWGEMNDGTTDKELYRIQDHQLNNKWSLESDTSIYFLTVNPGSNFRLTPTTNALPSPLAPEPFFIHTVGKYYRERFHFGYAAVVGDYVYSSNYENGEGFTTLDIGINGIRTETFSNLIPYTGPGAPAPLVKVNATGNALNPRTVEIKLNGTVIGSPVMDFFDYIKTNIAISPTDISSGTAVIDVKNANITGGDRMVIAQTELQYPRMFNFGGANNFSFELPANTSGNYLEITGFNYGSTSPVLYDMTNGKRYIADITNAPIIKIALQPSSVSRKLLLITQESSFPMAVTSLEQRNFINYGLPANKGDYLIISHSALMTGPGGNPVENYRSYRSSAIGGSYNAKIYLIDQLVDQFSFGIKNHPLSVRNFLRWARTNFGNIKDVFIIGKGLQYVQNRTFEANPDFHKLSFVPTFGHPASDNLLTADPGLDVTPKLSIGRLSVINGNEVAIYLNKVIQYEQKLAFQSPVIADKAWQKNVVHVIGAGDGSLGTILTNAMNGFGSIIKDTFYGANLHTFSKVSTAPVEQANAAKLYGLFEEGIGILTYFGHSSASTLEFNLDNPDGYNNPGKYPVFILLGCSAGNFYNFNLARLSTKETISEKFVLADQRGSIATIASTHLGIVNYLDIYNTQTMKAASVNQYGKTLGEIMRDAVTNVYNIMTQNDYYARFHCEQTTLHGDPALRLDASFPKPDYAIEPQLVEINPSFISVAENSFKIKAKFINLGKAINKPIVIELKRTYPDLSTDIRRDTIPGIRFMDSLTYNVPILSTRDKGLNKISICIDADNTVDEIYETNNCVSKDFFIYEDEIRPVFPFNYAIVNRQNIKFHASTANPFTVSRQYNFEIDTTEAFNSPFKKTQSVTSVGGVIEFNPVITFTDSTVYYWRVSPVPVSGTPVWNYASFVYLPNSQPGFNQSHYFQHDRSLKNKIVLNAQSRNWEFDSVPHFIFAKNGVFLTATSQEGDLIVAPDGSAFIRSACVGFSLIFNLIDPKSFVTSLNPSSFMGSADNNCVAPPSSRRWNFEWSYMTAAKRKEMMDFMDWIPNGTIVVVRNILNPGQPAGGFIDSWKNDTLLYGSGNSLYHRLKAAGMNVLDSFTSPKAMIFIYQKGSPSFGPVGTVSAGIYDLVALNKNLKTPDSIGFVTSPVYGRAKAWKQLIWRGASDATSDTATVDVIGVQLDGSEQTLFTDITTAQQDFDISSISVAQYPYLKLKLRAKDKGTYTPYQLRYWRVTYDPVPEGAIAPNIYLSVKDSLELGEPLTYKVAFKNVSDVPFDSVKVKMVITDRNNVPYNVPIPRRRKLPVSDTLQIGALINSNTIPGHNTVYLEANPDDDQPEQYHFNNFAYRNLYVKPDSLDPLLDVTFDGVHILNRDIVSSKPDIVIKLKDEARWMVLDDTSLLTLFIRYKGGPARRYYFSNDTMRFIPAGQAPNPDNTASINFKPHFLQDGEYEMIITGKDKSDNNAGNIEYRVLFEVVNKPMISNMLNYPNPFTTSTAFVFYITGSEVPQNIKIEIMTITGKIVREITKAELGPLHIGRNITEFKWDGTDQYGSKLANGVYLYRVVTNLNGKSLDKYKPSGDETDKFFNKGYGKMYLMR
ncbi:MAG TPA: C25 family cysteine peptidase [Chitinophagaceae bacterium]|nr:C25 family cysteine peptidase [Chitinophagaceae bacterium]